MIGAMQKRRAVRLVVSRVFSERRHGKLAGAHGACVWVMALACGFLLQGLAWADWRVEAQSTAIPLGHGAWEVNKHLSGGSGGAELRLVYFDASRCALRVVDQSSPSRSNGVALDRAMRSVHALAGCNGSYFTETFAPMGLQIANGKRTGSFERSSLLTGMIVVKRGTPLILWRDELTSYAGVSDALQAGPRLVNAGKAVAGLDRNKSRPRTFVVTDSRGHFALGTCRSVTLAEMGDILASSRVIKEIAVDRALNLDGGSSTGLWFRDDRGDEHYEKEYSTVRNFLAVTARN